MNDAPESGKPAAPDDLAGLPDDALRELVKRGQAILAGREQERRQEAEREIRRIAKEHGLKVDVGERRRRGRPPKKQEPSP